MGGAVVNRLLILSVIVGLTACGKGYGQDSENRLGLAAGYSWKDREDFSHYELYVQHPVTGHSLWRTRWSGDVGLHGAIAVLDGGAGTGALFTTGPDFSLTSPARKLRLAGGIGLTLLTRIDYRKQDFGGNPQFSSYIGLGYRLPWNLEIAYRLQHISNAGLYRANSGINVSLFQVNWLFR